MLCACVQYLGQRGGLYVIGGEGQALTTTSSFTMHIHVKILDQEGDWVK